MQTISNAKSDTQGDLATDVGDRVFSTVLADPPWRFQNRTGKIAPEYARLARYQTMSLAEICELPVRSVVKETSHLYLWVPNALLPCGLDAMAAWGFTYKTSIVWYKIRKDGGPDRRGVGFYFRNVTETLLFGVRGPKARTLPPARSRANIIQSRKREHSRKPDEQYELIEACSPGPYIELFARCPRDGWFSWGNESDKYVSQMLPPYANQPLATVGVQPAYAKPEPEDIFSY